MGNNSITDADVLEQPNELFDEMMSEVFDAYKGNDNAKNTLRMAFQAGWLAAFSQQKVTTEKMVELYMQAFRNDALMRSGSQTEKKQ